jgi:hypothetical protein
MKFFVRRRHASSARRDSLLFRSASHREAKISAAAKESGLSIIQQQLQTKNIASVCTGGKL